MPGAPRQLFDPEAPPVGAAGQPGAFDPELHRDTHPDVHSVSGLYEAVEGALTRAFPRTRPLWVRGEIAHLSDHRSGHLYVDLVDPDAGEGRGGPRGRGGAPTLHVKCWRTSWGPLRHGLAKQGIELAEGMVVVLRGTLDLYRAKGEVSLILVEIDVTALLGQMAAQRAQLLGALEKEGLLRRNATLPVPEPALRIGLVASPGTEGCRDFLGQLTGSGFGFAVSHVKVPVQGPGAPASIARALTMLSRSDCDVIALVRGGGARADLAAFESEVVARSICGAGKPVFTGIGHTGDETVADIVAARACITPTECGHQLALAARRWWVDHVGAPADALIRRAPSFLADAQTRDAQARRRLSNAARTQLRLHAERLRAKAGSLSQGAPRRLESREASLRADAARLGPLAFGHVGRSDERLEGWRRLLVAYDVDRQLERGYTLTLTPAGGLVRSADQLEDGAQIVTRFADGSVRSRVEERVEERVEDKGETAAREAGAGTAESGGGQG
jgi:exodeoxyribonuclease VII large subunit